MNIQFNIDDKKQGSFFIEQNGKQVAELNFEINNGTLNAYHTGVEKELEGQGIAGKLFDALIRYARENRCKITPSCPYILAKFRRNPEVFTDIWHQPDDETLIANACEIKPKHPL